MQRYVYANRYTLMTTFLDSIMSNAHKILRQNKNNRRYNYGCRNLYVVLVLTIHNHLL